MKFDSRDIYEQVGNLFYSIGVAQRLGPLDVANLKLLISKIWLPANIEADIQAASDEAHCILVTIDSLQGRRVPSNDAYEEFAKFYILHVELFPDDLKTRMLKTATAITKNFKNDSPFENIYVSSLKDLLHRTGVETV